MSVALYSLKWLATYPETLQYFSISTLPSPSTHFRHQKKHPSQQLWRRSSLCMNGCRGDPTVPIGTIQTRTFSPVSTPALAMDRLLSAVSELGLYPSPSDSGIIRLQVPIEQQIQAIDWLHSQHDLLPRCFFSSRRTSSGSNSDILQTQSTNGNPRNSVNPSLLSVAGVGAAVFFRKFYPFAYNDWKLIKRFLSKNHPLIRAYGAMRFDARANISAEWEAFGSFYFMIPQVEFDELEGSSILAINIAWDNALSRTWIKAIEAFKVTIHKIFSVVQKYEKKCPKTLILSINQIPDRMSWDLSVWKALQLINGSNSPLKKVVLARRSRFQMSTDIDPIEWLAGLQVEGENAYQFCLQPPDSAAFIANTPEQLFHRNFLSIQSEALAGTRARGGSNGLDLQIELDLLSSSKDDLEFTIVRESIRSKLEVICNRVLVKPSKAIRKLSRVQHLHAQLTGTLRSEDDEFAILSSLHPSPAVCGFPTDESRILIAESEKFDRGMYSGPVGWFGGGETEFAVGIRSALVEKDVGALIYAGTGIVEGSNASLEWEELELKTSQFTKLVNMMSLSVDSEKYSKK